VEIVNVKIGEQMELMKLNQKELSKELRGMTSSELLTLYNSLEYMQRISTNGVLIWEMVIRTSGSRMYKSIQR
jgi:hypothetical protein